MNEKIITESETAMTIPREYYEKDSWFRVWQSVYRGDALLQCGKALRPYGLKITVCDKDNKSDADWWFKVEWDDPDN